MESKLKRYLKYKTTGKTLTAYFIDRTGLVLFSFFSIFLFNIYKSYHIFSSLIFALLGTIFILLSVNIFYDEKTNNKTNKYIEDIKNELKLEAFSLSPFKYKFNIALRILDTNKEDCYISNGIVISKRKNMLCCVFNKYYKDEISASDIAALIIRQRKLQIRNATVISACPYSSDAISLANSHGISLISQTKLLEHLDFDIKQSEIEERLRLDMEKEATIKKQKLLLFKSKGSVFYIFVSLGFSICSLIFGFSYFYGIMSGISVILSTISYISENKSDKKSV